MPRKPKYRAKKAPIDIDDDDDNVDQDECYDDVDRFTNQRETIPLDLANDEADSDAESEGLFPVDDDEEESDEDAKWYSYNNNFGRKLPSDMESDIEEEKSGEIDSGAWGKKKGTYYDTNYVDPDYDNFAGSDEDQAEEEEREALELQKKLTAMYDDADFGMDMFKKAEAVPTGADERVDIDVENLSKNEKLELVNADSPELIGIIEDVKEKLGELCEMLEKDGDKVRTSEFGSTKLKMLLNYCLNSMFYLAMKAKRVQMANHPVRKVIVNYQELLQQLKSVEGKYANLDFVLPEQKEIQEKRVRFKKRLREEYDESGKVPRMDTLTEEENEEEDEMDGKRAISKQIATNRGLTPKRKKEYKNPRVKHRIKFKKAKIRRKGQVREARTEVSRYGGEISGINVGVRKGIKIK